MNDATPSTGDPFAPTADPARYVPRPATERALDELTGALERGDRIVALQGPPGMGKTLLLRVLERRLSSRHTTVSIPYAALAPDELCRFVLGLLGRQESARRGTRDDLVEIARVVAAAGRPLLLLVDDASALPVESATLLASLVQSVAMRVVAAGLDRIDAGASPARDWVAELAATRVRLDAPMSREETAAHLRALLDRADSDARRRLDANVAARLFAASGGVVRELHGHASEWLRRGDAALPSSPLATVETTPPVSTPRQQEAPPPPVVPSSGPPPAAREAASPPVSPTSPTPAAPPRESSPAASTAPVQPATAVAPATSVSQPGSPPGVVAVPGPAAAPSAERAPAAALRPILQPTPVAPAPPPGPAVPERPSVGARAGTAETRAEAPPPVARTPVASPAATASPPAAASKPVATTTPVGSSRETPVVTPPPAKPAVAAKPPATAKPSGTAAASSSPNEPRAKDEIGVTPDAAARPPARTLARAPRGIEIFLALVVLAGLALLLPRLRSGAPVPPIEERATDGGAALEPAPVARDRIAPGELAPVPPTTAPAPVTTTRLDEARPEPKPEPPPSLVPSAAPSTESAEPPPASEVTPVAEKIPAAPVPAESPLPQPEPPEAARSADPHPSAQAAAPPSASASSAPERKPEAPSPPPATTIAVNINATPWATIEIDGVDLGETPLAGVPLLEGKHRVRARMPDGRVIEREVDVDASRRHLAFE